MNALDALGPRAAPVLSEIRALPTKDPKAPERANGYLGRLKSSLLNGLHSRQSKDGN